MKTYQITINNHTYYAAVEELNGASPQASAASSFLPASGLPSVPSAPAAPTVPARPANAEAKPSPAPRPASAEGATAVKSPMPGTVTAIKVAEGQAVKGGDVLLLLEAMKMENEITAPCDGTIVAVLIKDGASVNTGDPLIEIV